MSNYSNNDYRDYLEHSWGKKPEQKAAEKAYNAKYYLENKARILAQRAKTAASNAGDKWDEFTGDKDRREAAEADRMSEYWDKTAANQFDDYNYKTHDERDRNRAIDSARRAQGYRNSAASARERANNSQLNRLKSDITSGRIVTNTVNSVKNATGVNAKAARDSAKSTYQKAKNTYDYHSSQIYDRTHTDMNPNARRMAEASESSARSAATAYHNAQKNYSNTPLGKAENAAKAGASAVANLLKKLRRG